MQKTLTILGSTGSIGRQTLEVADHLNIKIRALSADKSIELLETQIRKYSPELAAVYDEKAAQELKTRISDTDTLVVSGKDGQIKAARESGADIIVTAIAGQAGLEPTIAALETGKRIALANKEPLVCAGVQVMQTAKKHGAEIIPVDSEHSAIFQCLAGQQYEQANPHHFQTGQQFSQTDPQNPQTNSQNPKRNPKTEKIKSNPEINDPFMTHQVVYNKNIKKIILTASGGPFRGMTRTELEKITPEQALKHPNWNMGKKITIDSATLMNKGLELIEAMHLFNVDPDQIEVIIHPESIIHSMVEFTDGSTIAQLSNPDMRQPIQYALTYPDRQPSLTKPLDLIQLKSLTFEKPDMEAFPCLSLAYKAAKLGTKACAALNQANEEAVELFLNNKVGFNEIPKIIEEALKGSLCI